MPPPPPPPPTPTFRTITVLQRAKLSPRHFTAIFFRVLAHFDTKFVTRLGTVFCH